MYEPRETTAAKGTEARVHMLPGPPVRKWAGAVCVIVIGLGCIVFAIGVVVGRAMQCG